MKKTTFFRKGLALFLTLVVILGMMPTSALAGGDDYTLLEVAVSETTVRKTASENAEILAYVNNGDVLYCVDALYNEYDNLWYKVLCGDGYGYIYNGKVELHKHSMAELHLDDGTAVMYCRCGYGCVSEGGISDTGGAIALNPSPLVDIANALAAAGAAIKSGLAAAGAGAGAALPVVIVGAGLGLIIYAAYNSAATVEIIDITDATTDYQFDRFEDGKYYYAFIFNQQVHIIQSEELAMDKDEAADFLDAFATGQHILSAVVGSKNVPVASVYTLSDTDAAALGQALEMTGRYDYGNDSTPNHECAWNKRNIITGHGYFDHFHVFKTTFGNLKKVCHTHIFFGPIIYYNIPAV